MSGLEADALVLLTNVDGLLRQEPADAPRASESGAGPLSRFPWCGGDHAGIEGAGFGAIHERAWRDVYQDGSGGNRHELRRRGGDREWQRAGHADANFCG